MRRSRVVQVITRWVPGGARAVVRRLLDALPAAEFEQVLVTGAEGDDEPGAVRIPHLVREVSPRRDARAALALARLFLRLRPRVVHAHTYKAGVLACGAARVAGVPAVVFTPHGHIFEPGARIPGVPEPGRRLGALRWVTRAAQSCAHRVTALSEADLRDQLRLGLSPPSKYVVIPNGIDVDRFHAPPRGDGAGPVVGAVGRFTSEKGHEVLVEAFSRVRRRLPGARLILVGSGELESELRGRVARLGLDGSVTFAGARDASEMLPGFDVFVQPSNYESQGLAILEAMAAGRPVVATDVGGVRGVVRDGETGILVPRGDAPAMAEAIVRLAESPGLGRRLADRARAWVRERFAAGRMVDAYAALYRRLLGR